MDAEFTRIAPLPYFHFVFALACLYNEALLASDVNVDNYNSMELLNLSFFWPAKEKDLCGRRVNCFILARFISTCIQYVGRTRQVMLLCFTSEMAPATVPEHTAYTRPVWVDQSCSKNGAQQGGFI
ncbi:hypothetical protein OUZ56_005916 [Daphnia magna]|uniref:Uncharacterized protein n=1 Tax=Daphnia magna TaxID=35525 RepID=A0ABQ9YU45_9CRUS|nr:hypothetical protein OUZ56_005916 [Daphnia magna]